MRDFEQLSDVFKELEKLFETEGEYLSHQTALFFLGQIPEIPKIFTAVSPRRRRSRNFGDHSMVFIFHPKRRVKNTQTVSIGPTSLPVSTLEKTMLDILIDMAYAPELEPLAKLFATLTFQPHTLLDLAKEISDTVVKRASFFLAWSGRLSYKEFPFSDFTRTPICLDPRAKKSTSAWDRRFHMRFPTHLLSCPVPSLENTEKHVHSWEEFRSHELVLKIMTEEKRLFIRDDPSLVQENLCSKVFEHLLEKINEETIEPFLLGYPKNANNDERVRMLFPTLFYQWLDRKSFFPDSHREIITKWVHFNIHSPILQNLETAFFWGHRLGLHSIVIDGIDKNGNKLFNSGNIRILSPLCLEYISSPSPVPHSLHILAGRCLANENLPKKALEILYKAKTYFESLHNSELACGDIAYAIGNILRGMNRLDLSIAELFLAREYFEQSKDQRRITMVDCGLGNLFFTCGRNREAKAKYLSAISFMRSLGEKSALATLLGSLGLVEYECGRLRRSEQLLGRSQKLHGLLKNSWHQTRIAMSRAKSLLTMGYFTKAMKLFQECYKVKKSHNHHGGIYESAAFLAWICELSGSSAAAQAWWNTIPEAQVLGDFKEPRVALVFRYLKAMTELFSGNFVAAENWYNELLRNALSQDSSDLTKGNILHGLGVSQTFQKKPSAPQTLRQALNALSRNPERVQYIHLSLFSSLFFPDNFSEISPEVQCEKYISTQAFDPFWGFYAEKLFSSNAPKLQEYFFYHVRKTPPSMLNSFSIKIPGFSKLLKKVENCKSRSAEFLTHISSKGCKPIHFEDYLEMMKYKKKGTLLFDGLSGLLSFNQNQIRITPNTLPHKVLTHLFLSYPLSIDLDELFRAAWGSVFDPECDAGPLKSLLQRLRKALSSVFPGVRLRRQRTFSKFGAVDLSISCWWEAIV